jgi:hypothetical protein
MLLGGLAATGFGFADAEVSRPSSVSVAEAVVCGRPDDLQRHLPPFLKTERE